MGEHDDHTHHVVGHRRDVGPSRVGDHDVALDELRHLGNLVDAGAGAVHPPELLGGDEDLTGRPAVVYVGVPYLLYLLFIRSGDDELNIGVGVPQFCDAPLGLVS